MSRNGFVKRKGSTYQQPLIINSEYSDLPLIEVWEPLAMTGIGVLEEEEAMGPKRVGVDVTLSALADTLIEATELSTADDLNSGTATELFELRVVAEEGLPKVYGASEAEMARIGMIVIGMGFAFWMFAFERRFVSGRFPAALDEEGSPGAGRSTQERILMKRLGILEMQEDEYGCSNLMSSKVLGWDTLGLGRELASFGAGNPTAAVDTDV